MVATAPVWAAVGFVVDTLTGTTTWVRCAAFLTYFALCEVLGLLGCLAIWLRGLVEGWESEGYVGGNYRIQALWAWGVVVGARRIFRLRVDVEGDEQAVPGPLLILSRHVSGGDTLFAPMVFTGRHGLRLRYVLKAELVYDPCLDVCFHRLPNCFVRRGSNSSEQEVARVARLAEGLGERDAVIIWPEGTRFTEAKRDRILTRLEAEGDARLLAEARALRHLLPPRLGGPVRLIEETPGVDVLLVNHTGWEGAATLSDLWTGELLDRTIRFRYRRIPAAEVPRDAAAAEEWLLATWREMDRWVEELREDRPGQERG